MVGSGGCRIFQWVPTPKKGANLLFGKNFVEKAFDLWVKIALIVFEIEIEISFIFTVDM